MWMRERRWLSIWRRPYKCEALDVGKWCCLLIAWACAAYGRRINWGLGAKLRVSRAFAEPLCDRLVDKHEIRRIASVVIVMLCDGLWRCGRRGFSFVNITTGYTRGTLSIQHTMTSADIRSIFDLPKSSTDGGPSRKLTKERKPGVYNVWWLQLFILQRE